MYPRVPFSQFLLARIRKDRENLEKRIWMVAPDCPVDLEWTGGAAGHRPLESLASDSWKRVGALPLWWGPKFGQAWFRFRLPEAVVRDYPWLAWRESGEATLYVGGLPYAGFDPGHRYWRLPEDPGLLHVESTCISTGIWVPGHNAGIIDEDGSRVDAPMLYRRNEDAWKAWIELELVEEWLRLMLRREDPDHERAFSGDKYLGSHFELPPLVRQVLHRVNLALDRADREGLAVLAPALAEVREAFPAASYEPEAALTGHAHIDLVWLWPERIGEAKALHTFASMNRLLEQYPEFRFSYSQPASYRAVEQRAPGLMESVRKRIGEGAWEATGALDVESDTQITCGEGMVRSFLLGQEGFQELSGRAATVLWLPDVFGYAGYLPQLMREAGVTGFFTQKLSWNTIQRFPYSSFRWRGIDGSEVVSHVLLSDRGTGYNGTTGLAQLDNMARTHQQADVHPAFLAPTGYGDGGGGVTEQMLERARRLANWAGLPRTRWTRIEDFFEDLNERSAELPVWSGEIYLEYHRGVHTTHRALKAAFRGLERSLQVAEAVAAATGRFPDLQADWRRMIFAQFHDYIPGSSIHEVYQEGIPELEGIADRLAGDASAGLEQADSDSPSTEPCLFNPHGISRVCPVEGEPGGRLLTLPPYSGVALAGARPLAADEAVAVSGLTLNNNRVQASFHEDGTLESLMVDRRHLALDGPAVDLRVFRDNPVKYPAWEIDRHSLSQSTPAWGPVDRTVLGEGPLAGGLAFTRRIGKASTVRTCYRLEAGQACLHIRFEIDWQDPEHLLKVILPTRYRGRMVRYGSGFGSVLRDQLTGPLSVEAQFEVAASRWVAISDDAESEGLWLATRDTYGFGARDGLLHASLLKSAFVTDADQSRSLRDLEGISHYSDLGPTTVEMAIGLYQAGAPRCEQPAVMADLLFTPPVPYIGRPLDGPLAGIEGGDSLAPCWIKPAADGTGCILRLHEFLGKRGTACLHLARGWRFQRVTIREEPLGPPCEGPGFAFEPYTVYSLKLTGPPPGSIQ